MAIETGDADINQCPPGGTPTIRALSRLTGTSPKPLNPENGVTEPKVIAFIKESACIGCKLCIKACPVDCIIGAKKRMHTVIARECTGCTLCVPVCPTDCIDLVPAPLPAPTETPSLWPAFSREQTQKARRRTEQKLDRESVQEQRVQSARQVHPRETLQREIQAALLRKRQSRKDHRNLTHSTTDS